MPVISKALQKQQKQEAKEARKEKKLEEKRLKEEQEQKEQEEIAAKKKAEADEQAKLEAEVQAKLAEEEKKEAEEKAKKAQEAIEAREAADKAEVERKAKLVVNERQRLIAEVQKFSKLPANTKIADEDILTNRLHYKIERAETHHGVFARFYKATSPKGEAWLLKIVALATVPSKYKNHLLKDASKVMQYLKNNRHPAIIDIHEIFEGPKKLYVFMEQFHEGDNMEEQMKDKGARSQDESKALMKQVLDGLHFIHLVGIGHNNLKLTHILVDPELKQAKITGFGCASIAYDAVNDKVIRNAKHAKAHPHLAPESVQSEDQEEGKEGADTFSPLPADVWSWGVALFQTLTKRNPFDFGNDQPFDLQWQVKLKKEKVELPAPLMDLLGQVFVLDPEKRAKTNNLITHTWLTT